MAEASIIRSNQLREELIPIRRLPDLIPSSRPGARLALPTIYRWIFKGKLKARKIGGSLYVTVEDLADFISAEPLGASRSTTQPTAAAQRAGEELNRLLGKFRRAAISALPTEPGKASA